MSAFSVKPLVWNPYIDPVEVEQATPRQLAAMKVTPSNTKVSPYVRTLVHDPESYEARTKLYNTIMYAKGGLPHVDREFGALIASAVNGCIYCASVHARRHIDLAGDPATVRQVYVNGLDSRFDERTQALVDFCRALSKTPSQATPEQVATLAAHGFSRAEILDLIHAVAIFGWANRLMHTLGHAVPADPA